MLALAGAAAAPAILRSLEYPHADPKLLRAAPSSEHGPPPRYFSQKRDHFDASDTSTWQQAYYVNDTYFDGTGPVFLCVGGEGPPLSGASVSHSVHCNNAVEWLSEKKALMFAVEHRVPQLVSRYPTAHSTLAALPLSLVSLVWSFAHPHATAPRSPPQYYGCHNASACPYAPTDPMPLKWLSSRQALADLAAFHAHATAEFKLDAKRNKWVSFGGSYPGMLAGWFRVLYPELVHASVSSSAPVVAKVEMKEYNDIAARAYSLASVGGSAECRAAIADGHAAIGRMMNTSDGRSDLVKLFPIVASRGADWLRERAGRLEFAGGGVAYFPSQGNNPACTSSDCNIERICKTMTTGHAPRDNVANLAKVAKHLDLSSSPLLASPPPSPSPSPSPSPRRVRGTHNSLDYWGYQTCTEFGFYQTCDLGSGCFYTQGLNLLNDMDAFCMADYGISQPEIAASVARSNAFYGADRPDLAHNASRIMYVNGDVDPWSGLSILRSPSDGLPTLLVPGASHHAWTHPTYPTDQPSVVKARALIRQQVEAWLGEP